MAKNLHLIRGITFVILASVSYTLLSVFVKFSSSVNTNILLFFRYAFCLICIMSFVFYRLEYLKTSQFKFHLIRGTFGLLSIGAFFYALRFVPLSSAVLLSNTMPILIPITAWFLLRTPIIRRMYWGIITGFIGVFFILEPGKSGFQFAGLLALLSAIFRSISMIFIRTGLKKEHIVTVLFYYFFIGTAITGIFLIFNWNRPTTWPWMSIFLMAVFGALYQILMTYTLKNIPARIASPFLYLAVVFSAIADWLIWDRILSWSMLVGIVLVCLGGILTIVFGKEIIQKQHSK